MIPGDDPLNVAEGREALLLARSSLEHFVLKGEPLKISAPFTRGLALPCGAFVSLHTIDGMLRGCIGHMVGDGPLGELIVELAVAAGTRDPRFRPVTAGELPDLCYEISVLTPMKPIKPEDVKPGVHGLYVRKGANSGVLLPQVATEWGWSREEFLEHTCGKAGLAPDAWKDADTEILAFTAQVFSEDPAPQSAPGESVQSK